MMNMDADSITSPTYNNSPSFPSCLTCYLCGELFRRPRILPCGHTFCSECLAKLKDEIIHEGETSCGATSSSLMSSSDYQFTPGSLKSPLSPERDASSVVRPKSSQANGVHNNHNGDMLSMDVNEEYGSAVDYDDFRETYMHSSITSEAVLLRNPSPNKTANNRNILSRSDTYTVNKREASNDRTPSRLSCVSAEPRTKPCSQCGHPTPSRRRSPVSRSSSCMERSSKSQNRQDQITSSKGPRWDNSPQRKSQSNLSPPACSFEHKHGKEMEPFVCPMPDCSYSMRLMNLARWSPRNKAIANAVAAWRQMRGQAMDQCTQTDITTNQSLLVSIPRTLVNDQSIQPLNPRKRHSSMMDMAIDQAISIDGLQRGYLPRGHFTWRSYAAMVGMNILHQLVNL